MLSNQDYYITMAKDAGVHAIRAIRAGYPASSRCYAIAAAYYAGRALHYGYRPMAHCSK